MSLKGRHATRFVSFRGAAFLKTGDSKKPVCEITDRLLQYA